MLTFLSLAQPEAIRLPLRFCKTGSLKLTNSLIPDFTLIELIDEDLKPIFFFSIARTILIIRF